MFVCVKSAFAIVLCVSPQKMSEFDDERGEKVIIFYDKNAIKY